MKIYFFIGTTAELIRIAPIIKELKKREIEYVLITSGQVKVHFEDLKGYLGDVKADTAFKEKEKKSSSFHFCLWAIRTFIVAIIKLGEEFKTIDKSKVYFVICGDPVSTSIGAMVAFLYGLKIVHMESGDLSFNLLEPFPEEICRNINLQLATILFPPSRWAYNNLKNFNKIKINTHYNTQLECFMWAMNEKISISEKLNNKKYYILILHRQEHVFFRKGWSRQTLSRVLTQADPKLTCVLFNFSATVEMVKSLGIKSRKILIMPPVSYPEFLSMIKRSEFIATDGATNQYEAYLMGKPCLLLRDYTEQIEGIGKNVVLYQSDEEVLKKFMSDYNKLTTKPVNTNVKPSRIVVDNLIRLS